MMKPPEKIEIFAWRGNCRYCKGEVVVRRNHDTLQPDPKSCYCLLCGQPYFVEVSEDVIADWEALQWSQKFHVEELIMAVDLQKAVLRRLLQEIQRKNSWGKNELTALIADICAGVIDGTAGQQSDHDTPPKTHDHG